MTVRRPVIFGVALAFALGVAGWQSWLLSRTDDPGPAAEIRVGEAITVQGSRYRVDRFDVTTRLPHSEPEEPAIRAPEGTRMVMIILTTEIVDPSIDPETHYCFGELTDDRGRRWTTEYDVTSAVERPEAVGCSGTSEEDIRPHQPLKVGFSYLIPATVADEVRWELRLPPKDDYRLIVSR